MPNIPGSIPAVAPSPLDLTGTYRGGVPDAVTVVLGALELHTLADHHQQMAGEFRIDGDHEAGDLMEARAAELRSAADRAAAHWAELPAGAAR